MKTKFTSTLLTMILLWTGAFGTPMSGVYTIGGASPSYATFSLAVADLNFNGVNGPVVFNVRPGTYNENFVLSNYAGTSSTNTVIFQSSTGVAADVLLTYASTGIPDDWVVKFDETSYTTFNAITIKNTGAVYSRAVWLVNYSQHDTIKNCVLIAPVATTTTMTQIVIDAGDDGTPQYYNGFYNDTIYNGSYGFYTQGTGSCYVRNLLVKNNVFLNQYAYGISANGQFGLIKGNLIMTNSTDTGYYGIYINIAIDSLCNNKIINSPGNGIWWDNGAPNIFNNFITTTGTAATYGLTFTDMNESGTQSEIAYNTVLVRNTNPASAAFYIPAGYAQAIYFIRNNLFVNRGGGYAANIIATGEVNTSQSLYNNNDYYTTGAYLGRWNGANAATLADWQANLTGCNCGGDSHSMNINPSFVSNTDLHLAIDDMRFGLYDNLVLYDIDGQTRSTTLPDVGADESDSSQTAPPVHAAFTGGPVNICSGTTVTFTDASTGSPTSWKWSFPGGSPDTSTAQNPVVGYSVAGDYAVTLIVSNGSSADTLTDTGYVYVVTQPTSTLNQAPQSPVCSGDSTQIIELAGAQTYQWQLENAQGVFTDIVGANNVTFNTGPLTDSVTYRIIVSNGNCVDSSLIVPVAVNAAPSPTISTNNTLLCSGDSSQICVTGIYKSYYWNTTDTSTCTFAKQAGNYYVAVTDSNGCSAFSNTIAIAVHPPTLVSLIVQGDTISSFGAQSYQWLLNDTFLQGADTDFLVIQHIWCFGFLTLQVVDLNGCTARSNNYDIVCEGLPQLDESADMKLYPDPVMNQMSIDIVNASSPVKQVQLYDVLGRVALNKEYDHISTGPLSVDVSALQPGIYFVLVKAGAQQYLQRMVKGD